MGDNDFSDEIKEILGGKTINVTKGDWHISNLNSPLLFQAWYREGEGIYQFQIEEIEGKLVLQNLHREAQEVVI